MHIHDFLSNFYWHFSSISNFFRDIPLQNFWGWPWPLSSRGHLWSELFSTFESTHTTSYLTSFDNFSSSRTVFEFFDFKILGVWPWSLTIEDHIGWIEFSPFESPYMTSYLTSFDTFSLSRTVFEIFHYKIFGVWPWPLNFRGHLRSKIFPPFESTHTTFYSTSIDNLSSSRAVFEFFEFKILGVRPWPLTIKDHLGWNEFSSFESPYLTSYLTPFDTFSLSSTVFEIFDIKVFGVDLDLWSVMFTWVQ